MVAHAFSTMLRRSSRTDVHAQQQPKSPGFLSRLFHTARHSDDDGHDETRFRRPRRALDLDVFSSSASTASHIASSSSSSSNSGSLSAPPSPSSPYTRFSTAHHRYDPHGPGARREHDASALCVSEPSRSSRHLPKPRTNLRAALGRVTSSLRLRRARTPRNDALPLPPRLTLYHAADRIGEPLTDLIELFAGLDSCSVDSHSDSACGLPRRSQWPALRARDASEALDRVLCRHRPRPVSWPSVLPRCPDPPADALDSVFDFRVAADLVVDAEPEPETEPVPALLADCRCSEDDDDEPDSPVTPGFFHERAQTPLGLDMALKSAWSESDHGADADAEEDASSAVHDAAHAFSFPFGRSHRDAASVASLSLWPSPPGSPSFADRFRSLPRLNTKPTLQPAPTFSRFAFPRASIETDESDAWPRPESPSVRTARIRRETMERLEGRLPLPPLRI